MSYSPGAWDAQRPSRRGTEQAAIIGFQSHRLSLEQGSKMMEIATTEVTKAATRSPASPDALGRDPQCAAVEINRHGSRMRSRARLRARRLTSPLGSTPRSSALPPLFRIY
jgi:hypothetical protein